MKLTLRLYLGLFVLTTFISCQKESCLSTVCMNNGYCANGECVCPDGFTGADCSQQKTPTEIIISKIEVTSFPATDNGAGWDLTSGPEIYPELSLGNTVIWSSSIYFTNADPSTDYNFTLNPTFSLSSPNVQYTIRLYDHDDLDPDDFMGGINFTPYSSSNGFPSILLLDAGGDVTFKLHVSYAW